ncbi:hypothetical protein [Companilactobacillus ginsenosidimutans]|uniref:Poly-beta-1,6-N-acetyl-D-glucosamine biosynthesis protein PgaD n=1 Tax=Companilactobacillus ginsenosidimutans TaxID=1007676 RepID=A0A0H4QHZ5_9LACO|nr:hypothetical protein [Companilactobacillus ginsenosidimutans]AKP66646.1 hypothetical protein ABM34_03120 [Companilactobacillus ginsenosidimutans]
MRARRSKKSDSPVNGYIHDAFFEKGHWFLKTRQVLMTILSWVIMIIPIYWTISITLGSKHWKGQPFSIPEGKDLFYFFTKFFAYAFVILAIITIGFTLYNNWYTKYHVKRHAIYDEKRLLARREAIKDFYTSKFGERYYRRNNVRYYVVTPENNLEIKSIDKIYSKFEATKL